MDFGSTIRTPAKAPAAKRATTPSMRSATPKSPFPSSGPNAGNGSGTSGSGNNGSGLATPNGDLRKPPIPHFGKPTAAAAAAANGAPGGGRPPLTSPPCTPKVTNNGHGGGGRGGAAGQHDDSICVAVRVRKFLHREEGEELVVRMKDSTTQLTMPNGDRKLYTFDHCFWSHDPEDQENPFADQLYVFASIGQQLVDNAVNGFNSTILSYGQTGSGKTYSVFGPENAEPEQEGLIPRVGKELFSRLAANSENGCRYKVTASMIEVYLENVYDLLNDREKLGIRGSMDTGFHLPGLKRFDVTDYSAVARLLARGAESRTLAATELNELSSRAHTMFELELKQITPEKTVTSKICLVDLAGSERVKDSKVEGVKFTQTCHINKSLLNLGNCIEAIVEKAKHPSKTITVPFRDSSLTKLLKESLGGNSKTILLCAISPSATDLSQTLAALRFADRAKQIKTHAVINEDALRDAKATNQLLQERYKLKMQRLQEEMQLELRSAEITEKELELEAEAARLQREKDDLLLERSRQQHLTGEERRRLEERQAELERQHEAILRTQKETLMEREQLRHESSRVLAEQEEIQKKRQEEEEERLLLVEQLQSAREELEALQEEREQCAKQYKLEQQLTEAKLAAVTKELEEGEARWKKLETDLRDSFQSEIESLYRLQEVKQKKMKLEAEERERELQKERQQAEEKAKEDVERAEQRCQERVLAAEKQGQLREEATRAELGCAMDALKRDHQLELSRATTQFKQELEEAQRSHQLREVQSKEQHLREVDQLTQELARLRSDHQQQVAALRHELEEHYHAQLTAVMQRHAQQLADAHIASEEARKQEVADISARHAQELESVRQQAHAKEQQLRSEFAARAQEQERGHQEALGDAQSKLQLSRQDHKQALADWQAEKEELLRAAQQARKESDQRIAELEQSLQRSSGELCHVRDEREQLSQWQGQMQEMLLQMNRKFGTNPIMAAHGAAGAGAGAASPPSSPNNRR